MKYRQHIKCDHNTFIICLNNKLPKQAHKEQTILKNMHLEVERFKNHSENARLKTKYILTHLGDICKIILIVCTYIKYLINF